MAKSLVIVESPAKARTINKYLGPAYTVQASAGHVRDLPKRELGIDVEHGFEPKYVAIREKGRVLSAIRAAAKRAEKIYLATDFDREGEAIAWHILEAIGLKPADAYRVTFNEITKNAIKRAFESPGRIDMDKVFAQQARRVLDRLVGYKLSPLLWKKVVKGLSAGRVQSVAVMLIVQREREIRAFKPQEYWKLAANLAPSQDWKDAFTALLYKIDGNKCVITNEAEARRICEKAKSGPFVVEKIDRRQRRENPSPPFITSTLQQRAITQLGFSARKTMVIAQQLYEGVELGDEGSVALITYMRTDSVHLAESAVAEARDVIRQTFGAKYLPENPVHYRSNKDAQGAHEAIRPTEPARHPASVKNYLNADQWRLYDLIWRRFIACQMAPALFNVTLADIASGNCLFRAGGREMLFDGCLKVMLTSSREEQQLLPPLEPEQGLYLKELNPSQHFTQPPPRFTEATLVRVLEGKGIGRPSTYAPIISTIQERGYVRQEQRRFYATELGELVTDKLVKHFPTLINTDFTRQMEDKLDTVEAGKEDWVKVIDEFYKLFSADLEKASATMESEKGKPVETGITCDKCGKQMVYRWSRHGKFLGCSGYPDCKNTMQIEENGDVEEEPEITDEKCSLCGSPMIVKHGRNGRFLGCSNFPDCKFTKAIGAEKIEIPEELKKCDKCGSPMIVKFSRRGPFLACSAYPNCKNAKPLPREGESGKAKSGKPAGPNKPQKPKTTRVSSKKAAATSRASAAPAAAEKCEKCGATLVEKNGRFGPFLACPNYPKCKFTKKIS